MIVDCHVNIWNDDQITPPYAGQIGRVRPGGAPGLRAEADTRYRPMIEGIIHTKPFEHW